VLITGRDANAIWYRILFTESPAGYGWVRAEYVQVNPAAEIPIVEHGSGGSAVVLQKINVRSGPGAAFDSLGVLNPNDVVPVLGRDAGGSWVQIEFPGAPDGTGWGASEFMQIENIEALPVIGEPPSNAADEEEASAAVTWIAHADGDSMQAPLFQIQLGPQNAGAFQASGDVSAPQGDAEDWFSFQVDAVAITIELSCPNGAIQAELWNNSASSAESPACGKLLRMEGARNSAYLLRLFKPDIGEPGYSNYLLKVAVVR
jgi:hypothetical protein